MTTDPVTDPVAESTGGPREPGDGDTVIGDAPDNGYSHLEPLLAEYAAMDESAPGRAALADRLIRDLLPVARHLAQRYAHRGVPLEDLVQVASLGLVQAVNRYDPAFGSSFLPFAIPTIQGELRRYFRDRTWSMRVPRRLRDLSVKLNSATSQLTQRLGRAPKPSELAEHLRVSVEEVLEALEAGEAYSASSLDRALSIDTPGSAELSDLLGEDDPELERLEAQLTLEPLLQQLPARERNIVLMRFYGNMTQSQIAEKIGISQMHVSRLLARTLAEMRGTIEAT